jgi:hypothetical protein
MEPSPARIVIVKLKPGWSFDPDAGTVRRRGRCVQLLLPPGARLQAALPLPPHRGARSAAERELQRWIRLQPPDTMDADAALALVRDWVFVESAEVALSG